MEKKTIFTLPLPSTSIIRGPVLCTEGGDLVLSMDFDTDGERLPAAIRFTRQRAFRKRSEIYCMGWHVDGVYDTVCEITNSDWVAELRNAASSDRQSQWVMKHFIIYVDSFGCLEVVSETATLMV